GVSAAKGLCYGLDKPLVAINTLEGMTRNEQLTGQITPSTLLCPMIDARRMEVYSALFDSQHNWLEETRAVIVDETSFLGHLDQHTILFFGDGAAKCKSVITHPNAVFVDGITPSTRQTGQLAYEYYQRQRFENVAYFEPFYLKEFMGTVAKKPV
ncbi:MAG TPA: tRNA threonylcarbamoyladenosine biosynthesis protein TsaB, partial [Bacteroidia bacterium]|nr:tRNA threonylcarbamoyladenosine biosynthesis protein TsaB [Bacteroidia bacterium]